ncbi:MAG: Aldose 1-epimerase [Bryobacterales bacterium]|nr:Aldose 1-epimerase [Bryobacterales bacterium]
MTKECVTERNGQALFVFTLTNRNGLEARITNYGGILMSLRTPDRNGVFEDILLGFDTIHEYMAEPQWFFGGLIGRYANRIGDARFQLNGVQYTLRKNDGQHSLHGGDGFDRRVWTPEELTDGRLRLTYSSPHGEAGFPGNLLVHADYSLSDENALELAFHATADQDTPINLTAHPYFNLAGAGRGDVRRHVLMLNANRFTPVDPGLIPTGEMRYVSGTPFDFRSPIPIGTNIDNTSDEQLKIGLGYDHNWILNRTGDGMELAARVVEPTSGRMLEIHTAEPGIQFYSGNYLTDVAGKAGQRYGPRSGLCLETQHFPDSPNRPEFPSTLLKAGATFSSRTIWRFGNS